MTTRARAVVQYVSLQIGITWSLAMVLVLNRIMVMKGWLCCDVVFL